MLRIHWIKLTVCSMVLIAGVLVLTSVGSGGGAAQDRKPSTVEPLPGLALDLNVNAIEESATGGVISLSLDTFSNLQVDRLSLYMRLPANVIFADGSTERTWEVALDAGGRSTLSIDLLVAHPGLFHLTAEATGIHEGRAIRRGTAYQLTVGKHESALVIRDGAIEYRGRSSVRESGR